VLHGLWLLLCASSVPWLLERIPTAALAAVLVYTGAKLANPRAILGLIPYGKSEALIYLITVVVIVAADLLTGVLTGIGLSALKLLHTCSRLSVHFNHTPDNNRADLVLGGAATFLRL